MSELITPAEAAEIIGVTKRWVTSLLREGELEGQKVGHRWVIPKAVALAYKEKREQRLSQSDQPQK